MQLRKIPHVLNYNLTQPELSKFFDINQLAFKEGFRVDLRNILVKKNPFCVLKFNYSHVKKIKFKKENLLVICIKWKLQNTELVFNLMSFKFFKK